MLMKWRVEFGLGNQQLPMINFSFNTADILWHQPDESKVMVQIKIDTSAVKATRNYIYLFMGFPSS